MGAAKEPSVILPNPIGFDTGEISPSDALRGTRTRHSNNDGCDDNEGADEKKSHSRTDTEYN